MNIIQRFLKRKDRYIIEYRIKVNIYRYIVRGISEKDAADRFGTIWVNKNLEIYPFPMYKLMSVKKINKRIEII